MLLHKDQETPSMSRQDHCGLTIVCLFQVLKVGFSWNIFYLDSIPGHVTVIQNTLSWFPVTKEIILKQGRNQRMEKTQVWINPVEIKIGSSSPEI